MKIVITGASGFVGTALTRLLLDAGHVVTGLGTSPPIHCNRPRTSHGSVRTPPLAERGRRR